MSLSFLFLNFKENNWEAEFLELDNLNLEFSLHSATEGTSSNNNAFLNLVTAKPTSFPPHTTTGPTNVSESIPHSPKLAVADLPKSPILVYRRTNPKLVQQQSQTSNPTVSTENVTSIIG